MGVGGAMLKAATSNGAKPVPNAYQYVRRMEVEMDAEKIAELKQRLKELDAWLSEPPKSGKARNHTFFMSISALGE